MVTSSLAESLQRFNDTYAWGSLSLGHPPANDEEAWIRLSDLSDPEVALAVIKRFHAREEFRNDPLEVTGTSVFRDLCYIPLMVMGFIYATERRVIRLDGLAVNSAPYMQHWLLPEATAIALPSSQLSGEGSITVAASDQLLADSLFRELRRTYEPLLDSFRKHKLVATSNAWGSMLDFLGYGFWHAGEQEKGMDVVWEDWERVTAGRDFPVRRRPRRLLYEVDNEPNELAVRAGCCLWYVTAEAKASEHHYCTTCYLETDARRIVVMTDYLREKKRNEQEASQSSSK